MKPEMTLTLYRADTTGDAQNCAYRHEVHAENAAQLREALRYDHVFAKYRNSRRSNENFEYSEFLVLDCDNDHSDIRDDWIWPEDLAVMLSDVSFVTYSSKSNNKAKGSKSSRPRFHIIFPIKRVDDAEEYAAWKRKAVKSLPFFDHNALDAGRFFFGVNNPEVFFHPGEKLITDWLRAHEEIAGQAESVIPEGERNSTLYRTAADALSRFGDTQEAYDAFVKAVARCSPPLSPAETDSIWRNAHKYNRICKARLTDHSQDRSLPFSGPEWEEPIPLEGPELPDFPAEALPSVIADFVSAVAESLQVPPSMPAVASLGVLSLCLQRKFAVRLNADWLEPVNLYVKIIADPSEKKSPCEKQMMAPVHVYERDWNKEHSLEIATGRKLKDALSRKVENMEKMLASGRTSVEELQKAVREEQEFVPPEPLRLFVSDVTAEKLTSQIAANGGVCAIVGTEGGMLDNFAGRYSGGTNIDVLLNSYSGDSIRKDRVGSASETIENPALTILIMEQPSAFADFMNNKDFRGRGLTARFLYCFPKSMVGSRRQDVDTVPLEVRRRYEKLLRILLSTSMEEVREIRLTDRAEALRRAFADEIEHRLNGEYADIKDWAGKIVGTTMRIAGLLCLAQLADQLPGGGVSLDCIPDPVITKDQMECAFVIGTYFIEQAKAAYIRTGAVQLIELSKRALEAIKRNQLTEVSTRKLMKACSFLVTAEEAQKVIDNLESYGWLTARDPEARHGRGRPANTIYLVNPYLKQLKQLPAAT